nr:DUF222 domain-containing protein [Actinomycetales bacterium]
MTAIEEPLVPRDGDADARPGWTQRRGTRAEAQRERRADFRALKNAKAFPPEPEGYELAPVLSMERRYSAAANASFEAADEAIRTAQGGIEVAFDESFEAHFQAMQPVQHAAIMAEAARAANAAHAVMVRYAVQLANSPAFLFADAYGNLNSAAEEVGLALGVAAPMAGKWIAAGRDLFGRLSAIGEVFQRGEVPIGKACAIAEALRHIPDEVAWEVEAQILPEVATLTTRELERRISRLVIELEPDLAEARHQQARSRRHVSRLTQLPDGMASFRVCLPADGAVTVNAALNRAAASARTQGDSRTREQLRADALTSWGLEALVNGTELTLVVDGAPTGATVTVPPGRVHLTLPLEVAARAIPGWDPHPSPLPRIHEELNGPGYEALPGSAEGALDEDAAPELDGRIEAAWLEGYGPINPALAILMSAGGAWRRIITDTRTGLPLDVGRGSYQPPLGIQIAARLRDRTCSRPGCSADAVIADLDHIEEWEEGGETSLENLAVLCRRCHRLKSLGAGRIHPLTGDGERVWRTSLGRTYGRPLPRASRTVVNTMWVPVDGSELEAALATARAQGRDGELSEGLQAAAVEPVVEAPWVRPPARYRRPAQKGPTQGRRAAAARFRPSALPTLRATGRVRL